MRPLVIVWLVVLPLAVAGLIAVTVGPWPAMIGLIGVVVFTVVAPIPKMRELVGLAAESRRPQAEARQLQARKVALRRRRT